MEKCGLFCSTMPGVRSWLLLFCLLGQPAFAVDLFADDFESGSLSGWFCDACAVGPSSVSATGAAVHRGAFGFRLHDAAGSAGAGGEARAARNLSPSPSV